MSGLADILRSDPRYEGEYAPQFRQAVADAPTLLNYANNPSPGGLARVIGLAARVLSEQTNPTREDVSLGIMPGLPNPNGLARLIRGAGRDAGEYAIPSTPPATGLVRLFRGEGARTAEAADPRSAVDAARAALQGRWFTTDPVLAATYADIAPGPVGSRGRLLYVDVPAEIARAARVKGSPELERLAGGAHMAAAGDEHVLPPEWIRRARPFVQP